MKAWTGKQICNIPGDHRVFMTYDEFEEARAAYKTRRIDTIRGDWLTLTPSEREQFLGN